MFCDVSDVIMVCYEHDDFAFCRCWKKEKQKNKTNVLKIKASKCILWLLNMQELASLLRAVGAAPDSGEWVDPDDLAVRLKNWGRRFVDVTFEEDVTPYIHGERHVLDQVL